MVTFQFQHNAGDTSCASVHTLLYHTWLKNLLTEFHENVKVIMKRYPPPLQCAAKNT